jgi:hypothetical protein
MCRTSSIGLPLLLAALWISTGNRACAADDLSGAKLGTKITNVTLTRPDGKATTLHDFKDRKAIVVVFLNFECPVSNGSLSPLAALARIYGPKGVAFVGVCCGADAAGVAGQAKEFQPGLPVYTDEKFAANQAFKAEVTPEAFLLDPNFVLRYRGRIDNSYAARLKKNLAVTSHDLKDALDELLAGKPITVPLTKAIGCPIALDKISKKDGKITYYRDVLPILQNHCQSCHRPGEVGPFALMTYAQAVNWASDIKDYTQSRQMPPWKINAGVSFRNERMLSDRDITTLAAWVDDGAPEGDLRQAPPPKEFAEGWILGEPDLILEAKEDFIIGPGGRDLYRCFVLPTGLTEDRFVAAYQVKPGNPRIVHHTLNFIDTSGRGRQLEAAGQKKEKERKRAEYDVGPGYSQSMGIGFLPSGNIGGWAPGQQPYRLPDGYGWRLPKSSDIVLQVHYHRDGRVEKDRTRIGFYFVKKSSEVKPFKGGVLSGPFLVIPPNESQYKVTGTAKVVEDCTIYSIMPHMHLLGRSIKVTMKPPGGAAQALLLIQDWDYNWQESYFLHEPLHLKGGTVLEVEAIYDNSANNPNNPNRPPRFVIFGEQTTNEMCFVFFGVTSTGARRSPIMSDRADLRRALFQADPDVPAKKSGEDRD